MAVKLTPAQRKALVWIAEHEPVSQFPVAGPCHLAMVKKLMAMHLVAEAGREPGRFAFTRYGLTEMGREAWYAIAKAEPA